MPQVQRNGGARGDARTSVFSTIYSHNCDQTLAKEFGQVGDGSEGTPHESSIFYLAAGLLLLALLSSSLSGPCFEKALRITFAHLFLLSSSCGMWFMGCFWPLLLRQRARALFPSLVFPPGHLFLWKVWPWGRAVCACPVSLQRSHGFLAGFLASAEYISLLCPGKCAGTAGVCPGSGNPAGIATGWDYAIAVMPVSVPLPVDQECSSVSLRYLWSDNSQLWQDRQYVWS